MSRRRNREAAVPGAEAELDRLKYEVAEDLGLRDDVEQRGWGDMTTREVGHIGGQMVRRMVRFAEERLGELRNGGGDRQGAGKRGR
ncbi:MAG: alpha/beta-type small acid-soluble spore protein [Clostridia bacterium]|nr:alpha/beta-type small acid-soluble spore protein [Clostridia bacterium]